jgi:hypothetical protein
MEIQASKSLFTLEGERKGNKEGQGSGSCLREETLLQSLAWS